MALKQLNSFTRFDWEGFVKDKTLKCLNCGIWKNYDTGKTEGTRVEVVIIRDETEYPKKPDSTTVSNEFEKLTLKIRKENLNIPRAAIVQSLINPTVKIYGEYKNNLSIKADDIRYTMPPQK